MSNRVSDVSFTSVKRVPSASRLRHRPNTVSLAVFGVLSALVAASGSANSDTDQADTTDALGLTRVDDSVSCTRYGINRIVELRVSDAGQEPCEVAYLKPDEDQTTASLWRAQNDYGFCTLKFSEFITKLENKLLWDCGTGGKSAVTVSAASQEAPDGRPVSNAAATFLTPRLDDVRPGTAVSMNDVRTQIPSGPYQAIAIAGIDASACPPGGSFFWNTRDPDQPVFEMGQEAEFTFSTARGRVGQGFALQAEPPLFIERDDPSEYRVASLSVVAAGTVEARIRTIEETRTEREESICQYSLGGG